MSTLKYKLAMREYGKAYDLLSYEEKTYIYTLWVKAIRGTLSNLVKY